MSQDKAGIIKYIKSMLGHPVMTVELTEEQLEGVVDDALHWYSMYIGQFEQVKTPVGNKIIEIPEKYDCVVDVILREPQDNINNIWNWAGFQLNLQDAYYMNAGSGRLFSDYVQFTQYWEQGQRLFSGENQWTYVEYDRTLRLMASASGIQGDIVYIGKLKPEFFDLSKIKSPEFRLIRRYAYAIAMENLSWIRTKYSDVPTAEGGTSLNGDQLNSQAEVLRLGCDEKIKRIRKPMSFRMG